MPLAPPICNHALTTPIKADLLHAYLKSHPDQPLATRLVFSLQHGFTIGYTGPRVALHAPNLSSAYSHPEAVDQALVREIQAGRIAGPFETPPFPNLRCSGLGLVPKGESGWRLISHLSAPAGSSINDHISSDDYSLQYHTIDDAISILATLGPNAFMAKADLQNAFRLCPVHPLDWPLLGMQWRNQFSLTRVSHSAYARHHSSSTSWRMPSNGVCEYTLTFMTHFIIWMISSLRGRLTLPCATRLYPSSSHYANN